jgi:predicted ATPase
VLSDPSSGLTIRLFGSFEAHRRGARLRRLRTRKGEGLLALLVLRAGHPVARDWLAATLWPDSAPAAALANLRSSLMDLREALGDEAKLRLRPGRSSLALDASETEVDLLAFDAAIARDDTDSLQQAIALYRGPLLESCADEWVFPERLAREQSYLEALETLAGRALRADEPAVAERYLRRAIAVDPLREGAQRALMEALARSGSLAAALQLYEELHRHLRQQLHAEPDPATVALFERLRAEATVVGRTTNDPGVGVPTRPTTNGSDSSWVAGRWSLIDAPSAPPNNLPAQPTHLIGREEQVARVREALQRGETRLATLTGPGGTGKTRLALQVAAELLNDFPDGLFFVNLAPLREPELVPSTIALALGLRERQDRSPQVQLKEHLRGRRMLLLLDNFEQILPAALGVADLLQAAPGLKLLVTSRSVLHLRGEREFPVPPLALPDRTCPPAPEALAECPAIQLFLRRARDAQPDFALTIENAATVAEICHRLDGLPLAIELAAARLRVYSPEALLSRLVGAGPRARPSTGPRARPEGDHGGGGAPTHSPLRLLVDGYRDLPARQQTLRNTIAWSYDLLDEPGRRLFRRLSVFVGGLTLPAAEVIWAESESSRRIASLVEQSLLRQETTSDGEPRFSMLETIREYGQERLQEAGESDEVRARHACFFAQMARQAQTELGAPDGLHQTPRMDRVLRDLERDHDNLRAALEWYIERREVTRALEMVLTMTSFWGHQGHVMERQQRLSAVLALTDPSDRTDLRAQVLCALGVAAYNRSDWGAARAALQESLAIQRERGDTGGIGHCLRLLGNVARDQEGDFTTARALYEESLALWRTLGDPGLLAAALGLLGMLLASQGDHAAGRALWEQFLAIQREHNNRPEAVRACHRLAIMSEHMGDHAAACAYAEEALRFRREQARISGVSLQRTRTRCREIGGQDGIAIRLHWEEELAISEAMHRGSGYFFRLFVWPLALEQGDYDRAATLLEEILARHREHGEGARTAQAMRGMAGIARYRGEYSRAQALLEESLALCRETQAHYFAVLVRADLAVLATEQGEHDTARELLETCAASHRPMGRDEDLAVTLTVLGEVERRRGEFERAQAHLEESLAAHRRMGGQRGLGAALAAVGRLRLAQNDPCAARAVFAESIAIRRARCDRLGIAECLEGLASAAVATGQHEAAAQMLGAAGAIREALGTPLPPVDRADSARLAAAITAALGEERAARAEAAGRAMTLDDAVCAALAQASPDGLPDYSFSTTRLL